jgi:hypothetical protein
MNDMNCEELINQVYYICKIRSKKLKVEESV